MDIRPIAVQNSLPVMLGAGLSSAKPARVLESQTSRFTVDANFQSHANDAGSSEEDLIIDGEAHSLSVSVDWGFKSDWQASLLVSGTKLSAGNLDNAVDQWHDLFDLDSGDRSRQAQNQFLVLYRSGQNEQIRTKPESGLSALSLGLARQLFASESTQLALHASINLPVSRSSALIGSDRADLTIELASSTLLSDHFGLHGNLAYLLVGDDVLFGIDTQNDVWQSSMGVHWRSSEQWRWSAQLDHHSAVFDSEIDELNRAAWQLAVAGDYTWGERGNSVQLYFTEDLSVNRAADFSFGLNFTYLY